VLVEVDWSAVAADVPPGDLLKIRPDLAARLWADPDEARFAAEFGIPFGRGLFVMTSGVAAESQGSPDGAFANEPEPEPEETPVGRLCKFGWITDASLHVNLADGTIWVSDGESDIEYELIHQDLSSLVYMLYLVESERPREEGRPLGREWDEAIRSISEKISAWDGVPCAEAAGFWGRFFESYPMY
jgi:hypothetical protein